MESRSAEARREASVFTTTPPPLCRRYRICRGSGRTNATTRRPAGLQSACKLLVPARRAPRTCPLPRRRGGRVRLKAAVLKTARAQALGSSNLPPSASISPITFATCPDDRRARRKVPGRVPVLTLGADGDGVWWGCYSVPRGVRPDGGSPPGSRRGGSRRSAARSSRPTPAVVGEALDIVARLEGRRDERVARGIELPWPNRRRAESAVPVLLDDSTKPLRSPEMDDGSNSSGPASSHTPATVEDIASRLDIPVAIVEAVVRRPGSRRVHRTGEGALRSGADRASVNARHHGRASVAQPGEPSGGGNRPQQQRVVAAPPVSSKGAFACSLPAYVQ